MSMALKRCVTFVFVSYDTLIGRRTLWRILSTPLLHNPSHRRSFREFRAFLGPSWRMLVTRK